MELNLGTALFAHKNERINIFNVKIGESGPQGTSIHRGGSNQTSSRISAALKMLEFLFQSSLSAYEMTSDKKIYVEWNGFSATCDGKNICLNEGKSKAGFSFPDIIVPDIVFELSCYGENVEFKECFSRICEDVEKNGAPSANSLYEFCDSYYFGCAKKKQTLNAEYNLLDQTISMAFNSAGLKPHALIVTQADKFWKRSKKDKGISKKQVKKESRGEKFLKRCIDGEFIIPYKWRDSEKEFIQPVSFLNSFVATSDFEELVNLVSARTNRIINRLNNGTDDYTAIEQDVCNTFFVGKPGTGKTTFAYGLSAATQMPVYTTALTKNTDEDEFEGKTKIVNGKPLFVSTDFLNAFEHGGIIILEEPNLADPAVLMGALGQAIEFPYIIKRNGYETIHRHPLCIIIAAMNIGTTGTKQLSQPFSNRFPETYRLEDPKKEDFINIIIKRTGASEPLANWIYDAYENIVFYLKKPDVNAEDIVMELSLRTCFGAVRLIHDGIDPRRALSRTLVGAIARVDLELAEDIERDLISSLINPPIE